MKENKKKTYIILIAALSLLALIVILVFSSSIATRQPDNDATLQIEDLPAVLNFHLPVPSSWSVKYYECVLPAPGDHIAFAAISCDGGPSPTMFSWRSATAEDAKMLRESMQELNDILENENYEPIPPQYLSTDWKSLPLFLEEPDPKILRFCYLAYDQSNEIIYMLARD